MNQLNFKVSPTSTETPKLKFSKASKVSVESNAAGFVSVYVSIGGKRYDYVGREKINGRLVFFDTNQLPYSHFYLKFAKGKSFDVTIKWG